MNGLTQLIAYEHKKNFAHWCNNLYLCTFILCIGTSVDAIYKMNRFVKRLYSLAIMAMVSMVWVLAVGTLQSCTNSDDAALEGSYNSEGGTPYIGKWTVGNQTAAKSTVLVCADYFQVSNVPCEEILNQLFPGKTISNAQCSIGTGRLRFDSTPTSDKSITYTIKPTEWRLTATIDGQPHRLALAISSISSSTDYGSWASLSSAGILTIILHATSVTTDNNSPQPLSLRLSFTGKK